MAQKWHQKATVQGALVGAVGLIIAAFVQFLQVPALQEQIRSLERSSGEKNTELQRLETQLAPFKTIALQRYTGSSENEALTKLATQVELLQRLDEEKTAKIKALQEAVDKASQQAKPPTLSLASSKQTKVDGNLVATLQFIPSKNTPLGVVKFSAEVSRLRLNQPARIIDFWPAESSGPFQSGPGSKKIARDGYSAQLSYQPMSAGGISIKITVDSPATVTLQGDYLEKSLPIEIK